MTLKFLPILAAALALIPLDVRADSSTHGCACIENQTPITINYEFKWGDNAFAKANLPAGNSQRYCWKYLNPNDQSSPPFHIRYDFDVTTSGVQLHNYVLDRVRATNPQNCAQIGSFGKYHFRRTNNNTQIQLSKVPQ